MIRSTVARVDLAALQANSARSRHSSRGTLAPDDRLRVAACRHHRRRQGQRLRTRLGARRARARAGGGDDAGVRRYRRRHRAAPRRRAVPILVFGALSVSDLDGLFEFSLTPTISTPSRRARGPGGRGARQDDRRLSPEDRHRHEPARVPPRQPAADAARACWRARTCGSRRSTRTSRPRTIPDSPLFNDQRVRFEQASRRRVNLPSVGPGNSRRLRHACNSAALLRDSRVWYDIVRPGLLLYGIVPPPLASTIPLHAGDVAHQPRGGREGTAPG